MALSKKGKIWLIILAIPAVLIIGAIIFIKVYFTSDRLKAMIIPKIEAATNRDVQVGDISVKIFPSIGVSIDRLAVSNPRGMTFDRNETLTLENLTVNVNLFELFHNTLKVNRLILEKPDIYLEVKEDGTSNIKTPKKPGEAPSSTQTKMTGGELFLSNFEIHDGQVLSVDKKFDARYAISGLNLQASGESENNGQALKMDFSTDIDKFSYGSLASYLLADLPVKGEGTATIKMGENMVISIDSALIKLKDLPLSMRGTITNQPENMLLDLLISSPSATMDKLLSLVPPDMLKAAKGMSSSGKVEFSAVIKGISSDTMNPDVRGSFTISDGKIQYSGLPKAITNVNVNGMFEKPAGPVGAKGIGTLNIDKFAASLGGNDISGRLGVTNFTDPSVSANINGTVNLGEVKNFYPLEAGTEVNGMLKSNVSLDGKAKVPSSIKASGSLEFQDVTIKSAGSPKPLQHLTGAISFNNQAIQSRQLSMQIGESDLNLAFALNNYLGLVMKDAKEAGAPNATITLTSKQIRTADLAGEKSKDTTAVKTKTKTTDQTGVLPGFDITANVTIGRLVMQKFEFTNVHGTIKSSKGVVNLEGLNLNAYNGSITTKGTLDLRDTTKRPFDLALNIKNVDAHSMLPNFTSFGNYLQGKLNMNTTMKGDLNDTLGLNRQTLLGNGTAAISEGKLSGFPLTTKLADATGLESMRQLTFKDWANAFTIANGRFQVKDFNIHSGVSDFVVGGSQGLDGSLDYTLNMKVPPSLTSQLKLGGTADQVLQFLKDKDGKVNLAFVVTGTTDSPALRLDTKMAEDAAKKALQQKGTDLLKGKVEEGLKKLFKKP